MGGNFTAEARRRGAGGNFNGGASFEKLHQVYGKKTKVIEAGGIAVWRSMYRTMQLVIAEAGLAEAAEWDGLLIVSSILLLAAVFLAFSWWRRSKVTMVMALGLLLAIGALMQPWGLINPPLSDDPDDIYWLGWERKVAIIWAVLVFLALMCLTKVIRYRLFLRSQRNQV
ncbi:MAG: hypothetical protein QM796_15500 [Chthoniobacteraceae bacterium]